MAIINAVTTIARIGRSDVRNLLNFMVDEACVAEDIYQSGGIDDHQIGLCLSAAQAWMAEAGKPFKFARHHVESSDTSTYLTEVGALLRVPQSVGVLGIASPSHWTCVTHSYPQYLFLRDSIFGEIAIGSRDVTVADEDFAARALQSVDYIPFEERDPSRALCETWESSFGFRPQRNVRRRHAFEFDRRQIFILEAL